MLVFFFQKWQEMFQNKTTDFSTLKLGQIKPVCKAKQHIRLDRYTHGTFSINIYNEDINLPDYSCVTLAWTDGEIYSYKKFQAKLFTFCSLRQTLALSGTQHVQGKI